MTQVLHCHAMPCLALKAVCFHIKTLYLVHPQSCRIACAGCILGCCACPVQDVHDIAIWLITLFHSPYAADMPTFAQLSIGPLVLMLFGVLQLGILPRKADAKVTASITFNNYLFTPSNPCGWECAGLQ